MIFIFSNEKVSSRQFPKTESSISLCNHLDLSSDTFGREVGGGAKACPLPSFSLIVLLTNVSAWLTIAIYDVLPFLPTPSLSHQPSRRPQQNTSQNMNRKWFL